MFRRFMIAAAVLAAAVAGMGEPAGAATRRAEAPVLNFGDFTPVADAGATLTRTGNGLSFTLKTTAPAKNAETVWWVIFNNPAACSGGCGEDEINATFGSGGATNPWQLSVLNADGRVVSAAGGVTFAARLNVGSDGPGEVLMPGGVTNPMGADVVLVVVDHGPVSSDHQTRWEQLHTFAGGCGGPCPEVQIAIF